MEFRPAIIVVDQRIQTLHNPERSRHGHPLLNHVRLALQPPPCAFISSRFRLHRMSEPQRNPPSNQWIHTIRAAMAKDNSRTWFDAKVQEHGFDFLDDYLDRILAQAKQPQSVALLCSSRSRSYCTKDRLLSSSRRPVGEGTHKRKANPLFRLRVDFDLF